MPALREPLRRQGCPRTVAVNTQNHFVHHYSMSQYGDKRPWPETLHPTSSTLDAQYGSKRKNHVHVVLDRHVNLCAFAAIIFYNIFIGPCLLSVEGSHQSGCSSNHVRTIRENMMKVFPPLRLDATHTCLWRRADTGQEARVLLTPKAFAVLEHLVEHAGRLVTHDEMLQAVWPGTIVEPQAVKKHVLAVRTALGDCPKNSVFIETLTRRGYRFIAPVSWSVASNPVSGRPAQSTLVGRGGALDALGETWKRALRGERQIVFLTGEPGIGKTALAEVFRREIAVLDLSPRIARGQCMEGYGSKEAYGPILDALGRLCRGPQAEPIVRILSADAPTWLAQLPALLTREHRDMLQREIFGATRERMLREIANVLDSTTAETALLLILEDLHWVDASPAT